MPALVLKVMKSSRESIIYASASESPECPSCQYSASALTAIAIIRNIHIKNFFSIVINASFSVLVLFSR